MIREIQFRQKMGLYPLQKYLGCYLHNLKLDTTADPDLDVDANSAIYKAASSLVTGRFQKSCRQEQLPEAVPRLTASGLEW